MISKRYQEKKPVFSQSWHRQESTSLLLLQEPAACSCLAGILSTVYIDSPSAKFGFWLWFVGEATVADGLLNCKLKVNTYRNSLCKSQAHFPSSEKEKPLFSSVLKEKIFVAPRSWKADSPLVHPVDLFQRKKGCRVHKACCQQSCLLSRYLLGWSLMKGKKALREKCFEWGRYLFPHPRAEILAKYLFADGFDWNARLVLPTEWSCCINRKLWWATMQPLRTRKRRKDFEIDSSWGNWWFSGIMWDISS